MARIGYACVVATRSPSMPDSLITEVALMATFSAGLTVNVMPSGIRHPWVGRFRS